MNILSNTLRCVLVFFVLGATSAKANNTANQTDDLSPILPASDLPFRIVIEEAHFRLPKGIHSGIVGQYKGLWIFLAGSHFGLHGFGPDPFPPEGQNTDIYVVNPESGLVLSRSLKDPGSGLNQAQTDSLSTISPQGYQEANTLYMTGGYGYDTDTATFVTQPVLTAINLPGIVQWVTNPASNSTVLQNIQQVRHPLFQIAGGAMHRLGKLTQLVFGQNFTGVYSGGSNGEYSEQTRQFLIGEQDGRLSVSIYPSKPAVPDPNYRRRDLNIVPVLLNNNNLLEYGLVALSGVFTPDSGAWTVPVVIKEHGDPVMANPDLPATFKQGMNNYNSATVGLYSRKYASMYTLLLGGISYGFYSNGVFQTDSELPFINQITTVKLDRNGNFTQYLMDSEYPVILSTDVHPGNPLLFGTGAYFISTNIPKYPNDVLSLDAIRKKTVIGYIVGGIQSTVPNTTTDADSAASTYVFKVSLIPT